MKQFMVRHSYGLAVGWALFILLLCAAPGRFIPSAGWLQLLSIDKLAHAGLFFVQASLIMVAAQKSDAISAKWWWLSAAVLYGLLIEILQAVVFTDRSFEWFDALADAIGVLCAVLLRVRILRWSFT
jgi:hypothetical protein